VENIIPSHLKWVEREGRDNIPKMLYYARHHSFPPRVGK